MTIQVLIELQDAEGGRQRYTLGSGQYYLGKADTCAILLNDPHVSRHHATLEVSDTDVILTDNNSTNGTWFENQRILNPILLQAGDVLRMGTMALHIIDVHVPHSSDLSLDQAPEHSPLNVGIQTDPHEFAAAQDGPSSLDLQQQAAPRVMEITDVAAPDASTSTPQPSNSPTPSALESSVAIDPTLNRAPVEPPQYFDAAPATYSPNQAAHAKAAPATPPEPTKPSTEEIAAQHAELAAAVKMAESMIPAGPAGKGVPSSESEDHEAIRERAEELINSVNPLFTEGMNDPEKAAFQRKVIATAQQMVARELERIDREIRRRPPGPQVKDVNLDLVGFGDLQPLMDDSSISKIMINGLNGVYVEKHGRLEKLTFQFSDQEAVEKLIFKIIAPLGYDPSRVEPLLDIHLPDGAHLNIVFPPVAADGPLITIRKVQAVEFRSEHFLHYGSCAQQMLQFLGRCIQKKRNIFITGETGSGKTACLNVLTHMVNASERVVVVEDVPELSVQLPHAIQLQTRQAHLQGVTSLNTLMLVNNAFSMRPDRVVIGEIYTHNAFEMLLTMKNSHCGFMTTFQADSATDLIGQLVLGVLVRQPALPVSTVYDQISGAVNIVVTMSQFADGTRKISDIAEIIGVESGKPEVKSVFRFLQGGLNEQGLVWGRYQATGYIPSFYRQTVQGGEGVDLSIFRSDQDAVEQQ